MPHILVVEDEEHLAIGIKYNLEAEGFTVTTVGNGQAALAAIAAPDAPVDLVVLDLMLPGMSGYAVCESIRTQGRDTPVVMLTARTLVEDRIRGFDAGTDVYLQKPFDLDAAVNFDTWEASSGSKPVRLTNLEMKLLKYLVEHEGTVSSRSDLLKNVWGMAHTPATRTVDTFMLNLRKYFEADPARPVHFLSVRGMGYRFVKGKPASPAQERGGGDGGVGAPQE